METNEIRIGEIRSMSEKTKDKIYSAVAVIISLVFVIVLCAIKFFVARGEGCESIFDELKFCDTLYYEYIAENGYSISGIYAWQSPYIAGMWNGMSVWAFFPLVPLAVCVLHYLTFGLIDYNTLGILFSTVCMGFALYFIIQYLRKKNLKINYVLVTFVFLVNTYFVFYFSLYTESCFMMILAIFLNLCEEKKWLRAGFCLALLTATRVTGIFFVFWLFFKMLQDLKVENVARGGYNPWATIKNFFKNPRCILALAVSPAGIVAFMFALKYVWGLSPIAFIDVQMAWGKTNKFFVFHMLESYNVDTICNSILFVLRFVFCFYLIFGKKHYLAPILMMCFMVFSATSSMSSIDRYVTGMLLLSIEFYEFALEGWQKGENKSDAVTTKKIVSTIFIVVFVGFMIANTICALCVKTLALY